MNLEIVDGDGIVVERRKAERGEALRVIGEYIADGIAIKEVVATFAALDGPSPGPTTFRERSVDEPAGSWIDVRGLRVPLRAVLGPGEMMRVVLAHGEHK